MTTKLTREERELTARMGNTEANVRAMKRAKESGQPVSVTLLARIGQAGDPDDMGGGAPADDGDDDKSATRPPRPKAASTKAKGDTWPGPESAFREQCAATGADPDKAVAKFRAAGGRFQSDDEGEDDDGAPRRELTSRQVLEGHTLNRLARSGLALNRLATNAPDDERVAAAIAWCESN